MKKEKGSVFLPILFIFFLFIGFLIGYFVRGIISHEKASHAPRASLHKEQKQRPRISPQPPKPKPPAGASRVPAPSPVSHPRIAVIIDDFGNNLETARFFMSAPFPLAMSVLPQLPQSAEVAKEAGQAGKVVMLHLPLEAISHNHWLGPGALMTAMDDDALKKTMEADILTVPGAAGLNNHMGSRASADTRVARIVADEAKAHHYFVIDSLTAPNSVLYATAKSSGVPSNERDVFLDNEANEGAIRAQMDDLVNAARKNGSAIAIGHPHAETLKVLLETIPLLEKQGIEVVPVTELVR